MRVDLAPDLETSRYYDRDKFTSRMATCCDLALIGKSNAEIAEILDLAESTVCIWLGDERSHAYMRAAHEVKVEKIPDVMAFLEAEAINSVKVAKDIRDDPKVKSETRLRAAFGLADRAGYSPIQKVLTGKMQDLPKELAQRLDETLAESNEIQANFRYSVPANAET